MRKALWHFLLSIVVVCTLTSCEDLSFTDDDDDGGGGGDNAGGGGGGGASDSIELSSVVWQDTNVSGWEQTSTLNVTISGGTITLDYDKAGSWPAGTVDGTSVNANPWVFVNLDGTWYAATFEWLRPGQISKPTFTVDGSHIQASPLNSWSPTSGETYGFMVSGLARSSIRNVEERTQVVMATWP